MEGIYHRVIVTYPRQIARNKTKQMKKLIIIIVIVLLVVGLSISLGFFSPYNYFTAKRELKTNHFKKICINEKNLRFIVEKEMGDKYGLDVVNISNIYETRPINFFGI